MSVIVARECRKELRRKYKFKELEGCDLAFPCS